jgi:hypothetical protein
MFLPPPGLELLRPFEEATDILTELWKTKSFSSRLIHSQGEGERFSSLTFTAMDKSVSLV